MIIGLLQPTRWDVSPPELGPYLVPAARAANPYLQRRDDAPTIAPLARAVPGRRLARHVLVARERAERALADYLEDASDDPRLRMLFGASAQR
jgi:hypothetical protein